MTHDLQNEYLSSLVDREELLYDFLMKLAMEILDDSDFEIVEDVAHKLAGTGATYGFRKSAVQLLSLKT